MYSKSHPPLAAGGGSDSPVSSQVPSPFVAPAQRLSVAVGELWSSRKTESTPLSPWLCPRQPSATSQELFLIYVSVSEGLGCKNAFLSLPKKGF